MARFIVKLFRYAMLACLFISVIHFYLGKKTYVLNARKIRTSVEKLSGQHPTQCLHKLAVDLQRQFGTHIRLSPWLSVSMGGMNLRSSFLHAATTEYVAVFGTPISTSGSTGFHWANHSCTVLTGTVERYRDDGLSLAREEFGPGENFKTLFPESAVMRFADETWTVCYGKGFFPLSLPYMLTNNLMNLDVLNAGRLLVTIWNMYTSELVQWGSDLMASFSGK